MPCGALLAAVAGAAPTETVALLVVGRRPALAAVGDASPWTSLAAGAAVDDAHGARSGDSPLSWAGPEVEACFSEAGRPPALTAVDFAGGRMLALNYRGILKAKNEKNIPSKAKLNQAKAKEMSLYYSGGLPSK